MRKAGRKGRRKEGEGRKEGRKEGQKEGWMGRKKKGKPNFDHHRFVLRVEPLSIKESPCL